jgi:hypothetical protein
MNCPPEDVRKLPAAAVVDIDDAEGAVGDVVGHNILQAEIFINKI